MPQSKHFVEALMSKILSCKQVCELLGISRTTLYRNTNDGLIKMVRVSKGRVGWSADEIERFISDQTVNHIQK